mmetsp:Transcript_198/g.340  ORF Transcript_198/g.340 Transcript_198/m.340 type:complete len:202 (+) Transcript_198:14-619(+)
MKEVDIESIVNMHSSLQYEIVAIVLETDVKEKLMLKELEKVIEGANYHSIDVRYPKTIFKINGCTFTVYQNGRIVLVSTLPTIEQSQNVFTETLETKLGNRNLNTGYTYKTRPHYYILKIVAKVKFPFKIDLTRLKVILGEKCIYEPSINPAVLFHVEKDDRKIADAFIYASGQVIINTRSKLYIDTAKTMLFNVLKQAKE